MSLEDLCTLSYYRKVADIDSSKNVCLVQHTESHRFYVRKVLDIYNPNIYHWLQQSDCDYFPRVYECVESEKEDRTPCLVVIEEYIQGENYEEIFREHGPLSEEEAIKLGIALCRALSTIHALDPPVIHRDVKPSNMIRQRGGGLCLIDFNAAKVWTPHKEMDTVIMGTDGFAAPEQYGYHQCSMQTDIYGIGASLNYLLTGMTAREQLYTGTESPDGIQSAPGTQHSSEMHFSAEVQLSDIIRKATAFEPSARYQNVQEMMADLEKCPASIKNAQDAPAEPLPDSVPPRTWRRYLPPGFRSLKFAHMLPAVLGYLTVFSIGCNIVVTDEGKAVTEARLWMNRACAAAMMLHLIFYLCNYLGMREKTPFIHQIHSKLLRLLLIAGCVVLIAFFWVLLAVFLETLFFS